MTQTHILGFPRIGAQRELKHALESFWHGDDPDAARLVDTGRMLRARHWQAQRDAGQTLVTVGDFAWYDHILSLCVALGALPRRFGFDARQLSLSEYFALARGNADQPAMDMTKWFDTNYHHLVPELDAHTRFDGGVTWLWGEVDEAQALGHPVKAVLPGPITLLWVSRWYGDSQPGQDPRLSLLPRLLSGYRRLLDGLQARGVAWVQFDEPALCADLPPDWLAAVSQAYAALPTAGVHTLVATSFGTAAEHAERLAGLPIDGVHVDLVRAPEQLDAWLAAWPRDRVLSLGVVDGRNIWRTDLRRALSSLKAAHALWGDRLWLAPSCSLLHVPVSLAAETRLDPEVRSWLAFALDKLDELKVLAQALDEGDDAVASALQHSDAVAAGRRASPRVTYRAVQRRVADVSAAMTQRGSPFAERAARQQAALPLPALPTTTIGSFPQTAEIRRTRAAYRRGELSAEGYLHRIRDEIRQAVREQESLGLDVLVHGEAERNDMVEYFGEQLFGFAFTEHGWVQSYGSRCVKPPILYGDVLRPEPMTVETTRFAQSLTDRPMKGMLTGPVTLLQWSFVRDDQPRETTALQLALAVRDEVRDLEQAGIRVIQIDEPAFREGLPLRQRDWAHYLDWAVRAFRLASCGVRDETQIHTHMCYSEFNDILPAIAAMDADVITIETARSAMALLDGFGAFDYPNAIGPGVYDIHSPRVPTVEAMTTLLARAADVIPVARLWVNPDCGLKTRGWPETRAALANMVAAARLLRARWGLERMEAPPAQAA